MAIFQCISNLKYNPLVNPNYSMALWQGRSKRKSTGGRLSSNRSKKRFEIGRELQQAKIGGYNRKVARTRGGGLKNRLLRVEVASVTVNKSGKTFLSKILK